MQYHSLLLAWLAFAFGDLSNALVEGIATISAKDVERHEVVLTSDEFAGRDTPQPGLLKAAEYLAARYNEWGFEPPARDGTYLEHFSVTATSWSERDYLKVEKGDETFDFVPGVDYVPVRGSADGSFSGDVVFAGYGIVDEDRKYDDYYKTKVRDRVVLVLTHEPREDKKGKVFEGLEWTEGGRIDQKVIAAQEHGAKAVLIATDPSVHEDLSVLKTEYPRWGGRVGRGPEATIPVIHVSDRVVEALCGVDKVRTWQSEIDRKVKGAPKEIDGVRVSLYVELVTGPTRVPNVVALKRGTDPLLSDELVILGGHYDHLGADPWGQIYRGADDNGSGTSCLLEIAEALSSRDIMLKRSVMIMHFAAEEKGLVGATEYCKSPLFPLSDTVAMINMDMVGRGRPNDIDAVGLQFSSDLDGLVRKAISATRVKLRVGSEGMQYFKRSDQLPFYEAGVPVLFFMEPEEHADYHKVTDTLDKIDTEKIAKVARLVTALACLIADADRRPKAKTGKD